MQPIPIREVSQSYGVSTRTLRYYEEVGLIKSIRHPDNAYRAYDDEALRRLKQILVLRAMRIPLKQIHIILQGGHLADALKTMEYHAQLIAREMEALGMIHEALKECINELLRTGDLDTYQGVLSDQEARKLVETLALPIPTIKEDPAMPQLTDVRILYLPPTTVCACHGMGAEAENIAGELLINFIKETDLPTIKPDMRVYGFNHPNGEKPDGSDHGYEFWVTIPDDMEIKAPLTKKHFPGGLYAAHMIPIGAFEEWAWIVQWVESSKEYMPRWGDPACMNGLLEDHLNYINLVKLPPAEMEKRLQLDLLVPIQERT